MALARVHVWAEGEVLTATDLNGEINNLLNNPMALISPLLGNLNVNNNSITGVINVAASDDTINFLVGNVGTGALSIVESALQTTLLTTSTNVVNGSVLRFFHDVDPVDGQVTGIINWVAKSGGVPYLLGQHYLQRSAALNASAMYSTHIFTTQNAANQTDANTSASLSPSGVWTDASLAAGKHYTGEAMDGVLGRMKRLDTLGVYRGKWAPEGAEKHYSPTAEEFFEVFGLGTKPDEMLGGIAPKDVGWLAVKAVMELEERVNALETR